uniref:Uncharacterized protein n=1 Tax=viral metagenome TaxID=1070528 RepID=A0A6M3J3Y4_9ZZZZ
MATQWVASGGATRAELLALRATVLSMTRCALECSEPAEWRRALCGLRVIVELAAERELRGRGTP